MYRFTTLTLALALSGQVVAANISDEELKEKGLIGEVEFGMTSSSGNTEGSNLRGRTNLDYFWNNWRHNVQLEGKQAQDDEKVTAERYFGAYKADRKWSDEEYGFGRIAYENDRFNGLEDLVTVALGYGHRFTPSANARLDTEIGPGYRWNQAEDGAKEWILRGATKYDLKVSETSKFIESFTVDAGGENIISRSETSITTSIIGALAMKLSVTLTHQTDPGYESDGESKKNLDTVTAVTLLYKI